MNDIREMVDCTSREISRGKLSLAPAAIEIVLEYIGRDAQGQGWKWYGRIVQIEGLNVGYDEWGFESLP